MANKPTLDDIVGWQNLQSDPDDATLAIYEECYEAALEDIESRVNLPVGTTDTNYPYRVRMAILLLAARLAKRQTSPEGVAGMADLGAVVHILGRDPDIERLIMRLKKIGFA